MFDDEDADADARSVGDNSLAGDDRLRLLIERVENLEKEKSEITSDIKDVYAEARAVGYDVKIMRQIVKLRKMEPDNRREEEQIREAMMIALGMI